MLYTLLEKAINHALAQDPDTAYRLETVDGKVVQIHLTDWKIDCFLQIQKDKFKIYKDYISHVDTVIRGTLPGLIKATCSGVTGSALFEQGIQIEGDMELGEQVRDILRKIDLDTEEYLSRYIGDIAAHEITWHAKKFLNIGKRSWQSLLENVREFSQEEAQLFPTRRQVEDFYQQVAVIRDDVERTQLRVTRLEQKLNDRAVK